MNRSRTIVIADDNRDVADLLSHFVASLGLEVHTCYDGAQARTAIIELQPQLAMLDISMPGMDGCEVARWIRQHDAGYGTRLIALTGHTGNAEHEIMSEAGFDAVLTKPLDFDRLHDLIVGEAAA